MEYRHGRDESPPSHQEWAPSSNQACARQSHNYRPRQQILCTRYHSQRTSKRPPAIHFHSASPPRSHCPPARTRIFIHGGQRRKIRVEQCLVRNGFSSRQGRCRSWAKARRSAAVLLWRRVSACSRKRRRPGTFSQSCCLERDSAETESLGL
ncbi:hypothetical protein ACQKWADRAFT_281854 [Trichoderma austrokoningii]